MANYTSTIRYRDPASLSHHPYRDPPAYHPSYQRSHRDRPIHIIDSSSSISDISTDTIITRDRLAHGDRLSDDLLNNPVTRRVLPTLLSRSNDPDGRSVKLVMNYGNLYLDDSPDPVSPGSYRGRKSPNTLIYNAPGSTMAISSSSSSRTGRSLLRPPSPLVRTVSPSDRFSSPERVPRLHLPYRDSHFGRASYPRPHSQDRYGGGREQRRITYYDPSPPSPTYSSLSTITSSGTISASPPRMSGAIGSGVMDMHIDRRPMAMCLGCFKTMRVCSSGYCASCDFFNGPSGSGARGGTRDVYETEVVVERERERKRDRTPTRRITLSGGHGGGGGYRGSYTAGDDLATRRIRGVDVNMKGLGEKFQGLGFDGRKGRSREREIEFDVEIERGRDRGRDRDRDRDRDMVRELDRDRDRFKAKERAWERVEREKRTGLGGKGGAGYGTGGVRARHGDGRSWDYSSDSDY